MKFPKRCHWRLVVLLAGVLAGTGIRAEDNGDGTAAAEPLWEIGLAAGAVRLPHYRGSDEYRIYAIPLPFLIYRGRIFRSNREGVSSIFWENERFETGISLGGNPPVDGKNRARRDMPELGAMAEAGPMLKTYILPRDHPDLFYLLGAARLAASVDTSDLRVAHEGYRGELRLIYLNYSLFESQDLIFGLNGGVDFSDRDYARFFYGVEPRHATPERPAFAARGGYLGFNLSANATKKVNDRLTIAMFYRWDNMAGAASGDSPLVKARNNHVVGGALLWNWFRSSKASPYDVH